MRSQALENSAAAVEAVFILCLAMADNGISASDYQLSKERQSGASDQTDIRSVMIIDERKRDIIITTATTSNHSDDKDSRDATGNRRNALIESNRQTQSIDETRHRKTSDYDDDEEEEDEAKISSRIASKIRSPQVGQLDSHRVSQTNRRRAKRLTRRRQKRQNVGGKTQGGGSGRLVGNDGSQRMKLSSIHANEQISNLPPVLRWRVVATNDAEQMVIIGYMNNGRPDPKWQSAYDSAKKDEREVFKLILSVEGQESVYLIRNYRSLRTGVAQNDLTLDPEFKEFFSKPSVALNAYKKMKLEEADGLEELCKLCMTSPEKSDFAVSDKLQQPQKQEQTTRKSEAGTYKGDSFANNQIPPDRTTAPQAAMQRSQPGIQTVPLASKKSSWETGDSLVAAWDKFKLKAEFWNASSVLPIDLNKYTTATDIAERKILDAAVQKNEIPGKLIVSYNASKEIERKQLKGMIDNPPSGMTGAQVLAAYKALRKGTIWESLENDEKYRPLFSRPSAVRTQYEQLKRDESDSLDDFLRKPKDRTTGEKENVEETKRAETEKEEDKTRNSERTQREEKEEERLEDQRSEENEKQTNLEEQKRRAKLREILKQRSKMQKELQKERLDAEKEEEKAENLGVKQRREEKQEQKHNRRETDQMEKFKEDNLDQGEENAANSKEESSAGKQDVDIVERNVNESKRNDESTAPQNIEGNGSGSSASGSAAGGRRRSGALWFSIIVGIIAEVIAISLVLSSYRNKRSQRKKFDGESDPLHPDRRFPSAATTFAHTTTIQ